MSNRPKPRRIGAEHARPVLLAAVLSVATALLGGCVYDPYSGTYQPGVVAAAPAYGYYAPAYAPPPVYFGGPAIVVGGGWRGGREWYGYRH